MTSRSGQPSHPSLPSGPSIASPHSQARPPSHQRGPLSTVEIANTGIMAGLSVALGVLSAVFPVFQLAFQVAAIVPIAMVATAFRPRATVAVVAAAIVVSGAVGGALTAAQVAQSCLVGATIGALHRRGVGRVGASVAGVVIGAGVGAVTVSLLWVFDQSRTLFLEATRTGMTGYLKLVAYVPGASGVTAEATRMLGDFLSYWWLWVPLLVVVGTFVATLLSFVLLGAILRRLHYGSQVDRLDATAAIPGALTPSPSSSPCVLPSPAPLPLLLENVSFSYEDEARVILQDVTLRFEAGEFVVIAGANGSGKSTLASLIAGAQPSGGRISSPGPRGLGQVGGTAFLTQRSEVQVVGDTVWEDILWGLGPAHAQRATSPGGASPRSSQGTALHDGGLHDDGLHARAQRCLERVGLADKADLQTRRLSGGELQRLALAGALMRQPALLICDETTAMVDPAGRERLLSIFAEVAAEGTCVVCVTHDLSEAAAASRLIRMEAGRIVFDGEPGRDPECERALREGRASFIAPRRASDLYSTDELPSGKPAPLSESAPRGLDASPRPRVDANGQVEHLWLSRVCHHYDVLTPWEKPVLHEIDCIVSPGQSLLITGENGSGKSTLARIMAGLITPTWGRCLLANRPMWTRVGAVAISHQFARLQLLRPTVGEDILEAAGAHDLSGEERSAFIERALTTVGLPSSYADRGIDQLSGGQMRRVVLAGLLASEPSVLILDEPFAGLDSQSRQQLVSLLAAQRQRGMALIVISHDVEGLAGLCERHLILDHGRLIDPGTLAHPGTANATTNSTARNDTTCQRARPHLPSSPTMPRPFPWESGLTRMWLGTKILCWAALSTTLLFVPTWFSLVMTATVLVGATLVARVPRRAIPRFPLWFWAGMIGGMIGAWLGDGLLIFMRAFTLTVVIMWGTAIILWTSPTSSFPPTIRTLLSPLRWVGMPVKEWAHVMATTLKSVPLMRDQSQTIGDTLALRHYALRHGRGASAGEPSLFSHLNDILTASLSVAAQRANDLGRAMTMRGGIPPFPSSTPTLGPWDALGVAATLCAIGGIVVGATYFS